MFMPLSLKRAQCSDDDNFRLARALVSDLPYVKRDARIRV